MSCKPEIVEKRQLTNEYVAYRIVCCGEHCHPDHCAPNAHVCEESWHTVSIHRDDHDSYMQEKLAEVAARHTKMKAWREKHGK